MTLAQLSSPFLTEYLRRKFIPVDLTERKATCEDCLCSKSKGQGLPNYHKDLKCCTFHPFLPNYVVGGILGDSAVSDDLKQIVRKKILDREYALPMGIFAPVSYQVKFNLRQAEDFGNREEFLCPYFNRLKKNCGLWKYRGAVCSSYYCASDRGELGLQFWEILGEYLHLCEMSLAQDCIVSMGLSPESIDPQLEYVNCSTGTPEEMASISMSKSVFGVYWSEWPEGVEDFYLACAKHVRSLSEKSFEDLLADDTSALEEQLRGLILVFASPANQRP